MIPILPKEEYLDFFFFFWGGGGGVLKQFVVGVWGSGH